MALIVPFCSSTLWLETFADLDPVSSGVQFLEPRPYCRPVAWPAYRRTLSTHSSHIPTCSMSSAPAEAAIVPKQQKQTYIKLDDKWYLKSDYYCICIREVFNSYVCSLQINNSYSP